MCLCMRGFSLLVDLLVSICVCLSVEDVPASNLYYIEAHKMI